MLNRVLLRRALGDVLDGNPKPAAVITTVPITADLAASFPGVRWIYYCVDDFAEWPGLDGDTLRRMELDLLRHVTAVICVSDVLKRRLAGLGVSAHLLTHGVELEHWQAVRRRPLCGPGGGRRCCTGGMPTGGLTPISCCIWPRPAMSAWRGGTMRWMAG